MPVILTFPIADYPMERDNRIVGHYDTIYWSDVTLRPGLSQPDGCRDRGDSFLGLCAYHANEIVGIQIHTEEVVDDGINELRLVAMRKHLDTARDRLQLQLISQHD